jgi:predicted short-subunit dehydrogenase-like oxidoreductase (DUF2520 family)
MMRIVLLGTGNVATRLGLALQANNSEIVQVFGRSETKASHLAGLLGAPFTTSKSQLSRDADVYILAVSDDAITEMAANLFPGGDRLIIHTAGSTPMDVLAPFSANYGVLYPLQTLSLQREIDFSQVPVCIEANSEENLEKIQALATTISDQVVRMDSLHRRQLHLAAVFVCNFVNHLYAVGEELLNEQNLDFDLLRPLILETAGKAMQFSPQTVQTGPAVRGNLTIMENHLKMLEKHAEWQKIYELMSRDISRKSLRLGRGADWETRRL